MAVKQNLQSLKVGFWSMGKSKLEKEKRLFLGILFHLMGYAFAYNSRALLKIRISKQDKAGTKNIDAAYK